MYEFQEDSYLALNADHGYYKILGLTVLVLLCSHWLDLYDTARLNPPGELYFRLLLLPGVLAFILAAVAYVRPSLLVGSGSSTIGLLILTVALFGWRMDSRGWSSCRFWWSAFTFSDRRPCPARGSRLRQNPELGVEIVIGRAKWKARSPSRRCGTPDGRLSQTKIPSRHCRHGEPSRRYPDGPVAGIKAGRGQDRGSHQLAGKDLGQDRGRKSQSQLDGVWRRFSPQHSLQSGTPRTFVVHLAGGPHPRAPFIPFIMLAIRLDSKGPVFYTQTRVGKGNREFKVMKFRTMRQDAEAVSGPKWAGDNDPRVTRVGKFLRSSRLDEIPQLWCVLKGDMAFVGPRPERPEFIAMLSEKIPYYKVRHVVRPDSPDGAGEVQVWEHG